MRSAIDARWMTAGGDLPGTLSITKMRTAIEVPCFW